jgi:hypothetical protein
MKNKNIVSELVAAINNAGEHPNVNVRLAYLLDAVIPVMNSHEVTSDDAEDLLEATRLLTESQVDDILIAMREFEADRIDASFEYMEPYDDRGDHDGYFEKQYYQNPAGKCEDAPCCGCCGMF